MDLRIGQGFDVHQLVQGRPFILGGVKIEHDKGLSGHSDADALLHAITDAILGATAKGDIGLFFPDNDPKWRDADSKDLLKQVWTEVTSEGWSMVNLDCTVMTETPRLRKYIDEMRQSIASCLQVDIKLCGLKATTCEKMGFIGREEGLLSSAVVLLERKS